jgi:protein SCO1/2
MFSSEVLKNKVVVTNFFFTSCPSVCPRMMRNLQSVHELYRDDKEVALVSITVDPKRDTPERLRKYAQALHAETERWRFLTGEKKQIYPLARHGYFISAADGGSSEHDFIHSENLVLIDRVGRIRGYYNGLDEKAVDQLVNDILKLKKERS